MSQTDGKCEYGAAVQTRAKSEEVNQKKKELKVVHVPGTEVTTEELIELQKADETIEKYWDLSKQPTNINNKNSSEDEIANVNSLRRYGTYVLQNTKKENLLRLTN